jgi:hypothetical protein
MERDRPHGWEARLRTSKNGEGCVLPLLRRSQEADRTSMESANEQRRNEFGQRAKKKGLAIVASPFLANLVAGACNQRYLQLWSGAA